MGDSVKSFTYLDYLTMEQARDLVTRLAADPTIPYNVDSNCGDKTELYLGRMMQAGVPPAALGRVFNLLPDMSPEGVQRAFATGNLMHNAEPYGGLSFRERTIYWMRDQVSSSVDRPTAIFEQDATGTITVRTKGSNEVIKLGDVGQMFQFHNHIMPTLRVFNPETQRAEPMVIDLGYNTREPMTIAAWKAHQHFDDSVIMTAPLHQNFRIDVATLSARNAERLKRILDLDESASSDTLAATVAGLPPNENKKLTSDFLHLEHAPIKNAVLEVFGPNFDRLIAAGELPKWTADYEKRLEPLAEYAAWVKETDKRAICIDEKMLSALPYGTQPQELGASHCR